MLILLFIIYTIIMLLIMRLCDDKTAKRGVRFIAFGVLWPVWIGIFILYIVEKRLKRIVG